MVQSMYYGIVRRPNHNFNLLAFQINRVINSEAEPGKAMDKKICFNNHIPNTQS